LIRLGGLPPLAGFVVKIIVIFCVGDKLVLAIALAEPKKKKNQKRKRRKNKKGTLPAY
jgi:NADH:ubiquinone oxidoreductase subunit 2 (subunit N)